MLKRLAINTGANFAFVFFSMALSFISVPIFLAAVGAEGYGVLLLVGSIMSYFQVLNGGVPAGTIKYVAEFRARNDDKTVNEVINSSFLFYMAAGLAVASAVALFTVLGGIELFNISPERQQAATHILYAASVLTIVSWPLNTLSQTLAGLQRYPEKNLAEGLGGTFSKALAIVAALWGQPLITIFLCQQAGIFVTAGYNAHFLRKVFPHWNMRPRYFSFSTLQMIFQYSVWMLLGKLQTILIDKTDRIILALYLPVSSLTVYHIVTAPAKYIETFNYLFASTITPAVSATEAKSGRSGLDNFIYLATRYANAFIAPMAIIGALLCGPLISLWVGPEYLPYVWIAQIACIMKATHVLAGLYQVFDGTGVVKEKTLIGAFAATANVPLGIWWVQLVGVAGVVFSTIAARLINVPLMFIFAFPKLQIDVKRYLREVVLRGQWTSWVLGLLLVPFWGYFQAINSWLELGIHLFGLALLFYGGAVIFVVEERHRIRVRRGAASALTKLLSRA